MDGGLRLGHSVTLGWQDPCQDLNPDCWISNALTTDEGAIKEFLGFLANCSEDMEMKDGKLKQI